MGVAQNALLGAGAAVGVAASKFATGMSSMKSGKDSGQDSLKTKLAEISANKGLLEEYTKEYDNFMRTKNMRMKRGAWGEKEEKRAAFLESRIKDFQAMDEKLMGSFRDTISKGGNK